MTSNSIHSSSCVRVLRLSVAIVGLVLIGAPNGAAVGALATSSQPPAGQSTTLLPDGRTLLVGGVGADGPIGTVSSTNADTGESVVVGHLRQPRAWHTATLLPDGSVAILGGLDRNGRAVAVAEIFDPMSGAATVVQGGEVPRVHHTATLLPSGNVLIAGGVSEANAVHANAEIWDPIADQVIEMLAMRRGHRGHGAVLQADGGVLISGGMGANGTVTEGDELFDSISQSFSEAAVRNSEPELYLSVASPSDGSTDVPVTTRIALLFSRPVDVSTVNNRTFSLSGADGIVASLIVPAESGRVVFITPRTPFRRSSRYTLSVNGVADPSGFPAPAYIVNFTTEAERDAGGSGSDDETWIPDAMAIRNGWRSGRSTSGWQLLAPLQAAPGVTALAGQVLLLNGRPLSDVTLSVGQQISRTDRTGRFLLTGVPAGRQTLLIDGRSATTPGRTFGVFEARFEIRSGQTNVLPYTIWMSRLDTAHAVNIPSPTADAVVVTTPLIPGLEVHLPKGAVVKDHEGRVAHQITITPIPVDQPPFPLPTGVDVPVYFTIQPGGGYLESAGAWPAGARIVYPNYHADRPGTRINFWHYDPTERGWHVYGHGSVRSDGRQIVPDAGTAIYEFTGAMINDGQSPSADGPPPGGPSDGDPVDLGTGLFVHEKTDLALPDVLPLNLIRTYRPNDLVSRPFGIGATHLYAMFLWSAQQYTEGDLILPDGGRVHYVRTSPGTGWTDAVFEHTATPTAFYKSKITWITTGGWNLRLKDGTVYVFGENAPLQSIRDRYGNAITLTWSQINSYGSGFGSITKVTSHNGRWIAFTYDTSNRITQAVDNIGRTVGYEYDASGRLWKVTDVAGGVTEYTYDTSHRMTTIKDARGIVFMTNQYDANGRVTRQTQPDSSTYEFAYTLDGNGKITQVDVTNPAGHVRRTVFNSSRYPTSYTEALGTPLARTTTTTRQTGSNLITSVTDPLNRQTTYGYDGSGNVTSVTRLAGTADAVSTTFTYEPTFNQITSLTDPLNHTTALSYDATGPLTTVTDPLNQQTTFTHNSAGQVVTVTDALNHTTQFGYEFGDLLSITDPLGRQESRFVDAAGRVLRVINGLGHVTRYDYNPRDQVTVVSDALGGATTFTYDANGNLFTVTDARNSTTSYSYDSMDRMATRTDPLQRADGYLYDPNGNLRQLTDRKNQVTTYVHDGLDRLQTTTYSDNSTTAYTYDAGDRLLTLVDSIGGTITRTHDLLDRLTSEITSEGTISYGYDAADRRSSMSVAGQSAVNYAYDYADRLTSIVQGTSSVSLSYDGAGRRTALTLPNAIVVEYSYDSASQPTGLTYRLGGSTIGTLSYGYDSGANRSSVSGSWARTGLPIILTSATYDAANQITQWGTTPLVHDANGNLTSDGTSTFTWNARNELAAITGSVTASFGYDGFGRRRARTAAGLAMGFVSDGVNVAQELTAGTPSANLLTGLAVDEVVSRTDSVAARHFLLDALGSVVALTDGGGAVQTQYTYEPFGAASFTGSASNSTFQFTGRENDATGLFYYRARYYHPILQRFMGQDPIEFAGGDANLYAYVRSAPTNYTDPSGLVPMLPPPGCNPRKNPNSHMGLCNPALIGVGGMFGGARAAAGAAARGAAAASAAAAAAAKAAARAARDIQIDGPQGTRLVQVRYRGQPVARVDYGPYAGTHGQPQLHGHLPKIWPGYHIPLDPRAWF